MTLLEQFDAAQVEKHIDVYDFRYVGTPEVSSIRRAIAIAQAVEEYDSLELSRQIGDAGLGAIGWIMRRADELLGESK